MRLAGLSFAASVMKGLIIVYTGNSKQGYLRSTREQPSLGARSGLRPEPTLDEARTELSQVISRIIASLFKGKYGPLLDLISQPAIYEYLKGFESDLSRTKGDLTIVIEELLERGVPKNLRKKS